MQRRDPAKFASQSKDSVLPTLCFPDLQGACSERPYCRQSTYKQSLEICPELCCRLLLASLVTSSFKTQPCQSTPTKIFCKTTVNRIVAVCQVAIRLEMEGPQPASKGDVQLVQPYEARQATCFLFACCMPMVRSFAGGSTTQRERILRSRG